MKIEWTAAALTELDNMLAHVAAQDLSAARLLTERLLKAEKTIIRFPKAGRYDSETDTFDRYIPKTRIILTYALRDDTIWIVTVWHTLRDPETKPVRR